MADRTSENVPSHAAVIDLMAARGHALVDNLHDWPTWQVSSEQMAEIYRLIWPIASKDQLAEVASIGGLLMELAVLCEEHERAELGVGGGHDG